MKIAGVQYNALYSPRYRQDRNNNQKLRDNTPQDLSFGKSNFLSKLANTKAFKWSAADLIALCSHFGAYKLGRFVEEINPKIITPIVGEFSTPGKFPTMENPIKIIADNKNLYESVRRTGGDRLFMNSDTTIFKISNFYEIQNKLGQTIGWYDVIRDLSSLAQDKACKENMVKFAKVASNSYLREGIYVTTYDYFCPKSLDLYSSYGKLNSLSRDAGATDKGNKIHLQFFEFAVDK